MTDPMPDTDRSFDPPPLDRGLRSRTAHPSLTGGFQRVLPGCLVLGIGGLVVLLVVIVVAVVQWRWVLSGVVAEQVNQGILRSQLPEEQKRSILAAFEEVRQGFVDQHLTYAQLLKAGETVFVDPGIELGLLYYQRERLTESLKLSPHDQGALEQSLRRLAVGVYGGQVPVAAVGPALEPLYEPVPAGGSGPRRLRDPLHVDQVWAVIAAAALAAETAGIPVETAPVDVADRMRTQIAAVLGDWQTRLPAPAPTAE